jgi:hypothetical protein
MAIINYDTIDGEIIGECTDGVYTDYGVGALGSVIATIDSSSAVVNAYRFKPYGALLSRTGSGSDPRFDWVGSRGYRATARKISSTYIRARHYASALSGWTTVDRRWPYDKAFIYVNGRPVSLIDPSGLHPCEARTAAYCSWYRDFGFWGSSCFCYVSGKMCEFLKLPVEYICEQIHEWAAEGLNPILDILASQLCDAQVAAIRAWVECMNRDLFELCLEEAGRVLARGRQELLEGLVCRPAPSRLQFMWQTAVQPMGQPSNHGRLLPQSSAVRTEGVHGRKFAYRTMRAN